jgi:hypothetical protein
MNDAHLYSVGFVLNVLDAKDYKDAVKSISQSLLLQFKEIKTYNLEILEREEYAKLVRDLEFDCQDLINIALNNKQLTLDVLSQNDINKLKDFWSRYFDNQNFLNTISKLVKDFSDEALIKQKVDKLRIKGIGIYFENFDKIIINLKLIFNAIINSVKKVVPLKLEDDLKSMIFDKLYFNAPVKGDIKTKANYVKSKLKDYYLIGAYTHEEFMETLKHLQKAKQDVEGVIPQKKEMERPKSSYPRAFFKYDFKQAKGLGKIINKILSKPVGSIEIRAYDGTNFSDTLYFEYYEIGNDKKKFIKPLIDTVNEISNIFNNTERLYSHLGITPDVLKTNKVSQKNMFMSFYALDKKVSDFFFKFFTDVKVSGIFYPEKRYEAFLKMCLKILDVFQMSIFKVACDFYQASEAVLKQIGSNIERIAYFSNLIGIEISSTTMSVKRELSGFEENLKDK